MAQGLYQPALDAEKLVREWFEQLRELAPAPAFATEPDRAERHRALFDKFLAGLVTPAGALVARRLQEAAPYL